MSRSTSEIAIRRPGLTSDRVVDFGSSTGSIAGLSDDGSLMAVNYSGAGSGTDYMTYVVRTDSPELIRLGEGDPSGISPDGKWIVSFRPSSPGKIILYPTGTGEPRSFDIGPIANIGIFCSWTRDSSQFVYTGSESGKPPRAYRAGQRAPLPRRIYKLSLDGKVLGMLSNSGKQLGQFGRIHEIACPSENELYVAQILNWRVQKLNLEPTH